LFIVELGLEQWQHFLAMTGQSPDLGWGWGSEQWQYGPENKGSEPRPGPWGWGT